MFNLPKPLRILRYPGKRAGVLSRDGLPRLVIWCPRPNNVGLIEAASLTKKFAHVELLEKTLADLAHAANDHITNNMSNVDETEAVLMTLVAQAEGLLARLELNETDLRYVNDWYGGEIPEEAERAVNDGWDRVYLENFDELPMHDPTPPSDWVGVEIGYRVDKPGGHVFYEGESYGKARRKFMEIREITYFDKDWIVLSQICWPAGTDIGEEMATATRPLAEFNHPKEEVSERT